MRRVINERRSFLEEETNGNRTDGGNAFYSCRQIHVLASACSHSNCSLLLFFSYTNTNLVPLRCLSPLSLICRSRALRLPPSNFPLAKREERFTAEREPICSDSSTFLKIADSFILVRMLSSTPSCSHPMMVISSPSETTSQVPTANSALSL